MKSNSEIRKETRAIIGGKWFWRILAAGGMLYFINIAVAMLLRGAYAGMHVQTWPEFLAVKMQTAQQGLGYSVPSTGAACWMTGASLFEWFIYYIFGAIVIFGMATLTLKAVRDDGREWFSTSFNGFKRPLELCWLVVLINIKVWLWSLLFVIPGLVAVYRYRQAWYLKSDHPDWSASKCIAESCAMMNGHKWQACCLDAYFVMLILGAMVLMVLLATGVKAGGLIFAVSIVAQMLMFYFIVLFGCQYTTARAVFYRELNQKS